MQEKALFDPRSSILYPLALFARAPRIALLAAGVLLLVGCGAELYEQRLANTKLLYAHMDLLNQNLQGAWNDPSVGVQMRIPLQFAMLAPPAQAETKAGAGKPAAEAGEDMEQQEEETTEAIDDRQPEYINVELPGLRGAFRARVKVLGQSNTLEDGDAYMYVLTNHDEADSPERAQDFEKDLVNTLTEAVHESVTADEWHEEKFPPRPGSFVKPVPYRTVTITPSEEIAGLVRQFMIYVYQQGEIHVVVMFVVPRDIDAAEHMFERIPLCLETLEVTPGTKLWRPTTGAAAPVPGGTSF
jgi:hypothetical protein